MRFTFLFVFLSLSICHADDTFYWIDSGDRHVHMTSATSRKTTVQLPSSVVATGMDPSGALTVLTRTIESELTLKFHTINREGECTFATEIPVGEDEEFQRELVTISGTTYVVSRGTKDNALHFYSQAGEKKTLEIGDLPYFRETVSEGSRTHNIQKLWGLEVRDDRLFLTGCTKISDDAHTDGFFGHALLKVKLGEDTLSLSPESLIMATDFPKQKAIYRTRTSAISFCVPAHNEEHPETRIYTVSESHGQPVLCHIETLDGGFPQTNNALQHIGTQKLRLAIQPQTWGEWWAGKPAARHLMLTLSDELITLSKSAPAFWGVFNA